MKREVRDFFESYEIMNALSDDNDVKLSFFESKSRGTLQIRVMGTTSINGFGGNYVTSRMFCDVSVSSAIVEMTFYFKNSIDKEEMREIVKKIDFMCDSMKILGSQLSIKMISPRLDEVGKVFNFLEPLCRNIKK